MLRTRRRTSSLRRVRRLTQTLWPLRWRLERPGGVDPCVLYKVGLEGVQGLTDAVFAMGRMIREAGKDPVTAQAVRQWS